MSDPLQQYDPEQLQNVIREMDGRLKALEQSFVTAKSADELVQDGGALGATSYGDTLLDSDGVHTSAGLIDINTFYAVTPASDSLSNVVYAIAHDANNNCLYIGGDFLKTGGKMGGVLANSIVKYDLVTMEFVPLIDSGGVNGVTNPVKAITVDSSGNVYFVSGTSGGTALHKWVPSTTTFSVISTRAGIDFAIDVDSSDNVYIADYATIGITANQRILRKWNGASMTDIQNYGAKQIHVIYVDANDLVYFGGQSTTISSVTDYLWEYDGAVVSALVTSFNNVVRALWRDDDSEILYAGGDMTGYLHSYDGSAWSQVSTEVDGVVRAIAGANGVLYVGGDITDYAAAWDGVTWSQIGGGAFDDSVWRLIEVDGDVWIGGEFDTFKGRPARAFGVLIRTLESALNFLAPRYVPVQSNGDISMDGGTVADLLKLDASANTLAAILSSLTLGGAAITSIVPSSFTPTPTGITNVTSSSALGGYYLRVGSFVIAFGEINVRPTTNAILTEVDIALPISTTFSNVYNCNGAGARVATTPIAASIEGNTTTHKARMRFIANHTGSQQAFSFLFGYQIA